MLSCNWINWAPLRRMDWGPPLDCSRSARISAPSEHDVVVAAATAAGRHNLQLQTASQIIARRRRRRRPAKRRDDNHDADVARSSPEQRRLIARRPERRTIILDCGQLATERDRRLLTVVAAKAAPPEGPYIRCEWSGLPLGLMETRDLLMSRVGGNRGCSHHGRQSVT